MLRELLRSLRTQNLSRLDEVLVFLNGVDQETKDFLESQSDVKVVVSEKRVTPSEARNRLAEQVSSDYILFLDDDVIIPEGYFDEAYRLLDDHSPDVLGGPDRTPLDACLMEEAVGLCLSSPMATAMTRHRHHPKAKTAKGCEKKLILCNLWFKKSIFDHYKFDPRFFRNEENVLLVQLKDKNIVYSPDLFMYHRRKSSIYTISKAVGSSGFFRMKSFIHFPSSFNVAFLAPMLFVLFLFTLLLFPHDLMQLLFFTYLALGFGSALFVSKKKIVLAPLVFLLQALIHLSYGIGSLCYFYKFLVLRYR